MKPPEKKLMSFQWFEPRWSYQSRLKAELSRVLDLKMWIRIVAIVILLTILLACAAKRAFPGLEFNWGAALGASIGVCLMMLMLMAAILWFTSPVVRINPKGIFYQHGQSTRQRLRSDIRRITIDVSNPARPFLCVESSSRPLECGIPPQVSPENLTVFLRELFPELPVTEKR